MKLKFIISLFFLNISCFHSFSQEFKNKTFTIQKGLSDEDFLKAKKGYQNMCLSDDYIKLREATITFATKVNNKIDLESLSSEQGIINWITQNHQMTQFKSAEEGCELVRLVYRLHEKIDKEYKEILELASKGSFDQKKEIYKPEFGSESDLKKNEN